MWLEICRRGFGDFYPVTAVGLQSTIVYRVTVLGSGSDSGSGPYFGCSFGFWDLGFSDNGGNKALLWNIMMVFNPSCS